MYPKVQENLPREYQLLTKIERNSRDKRRQQQFSYTPVMMILLTQKKDHPRELNQVGNPLC